MTGILVVGAGPVGLTLACELARHGAPCRIIDKAPAPLPFCRAIGVTPRTLEVWEMMGIARDMVDAGLWLEGARQIVHGHPPHDETFDIPGLTYFELGLPQYETERLLTAHLNRFGTTIERGVALTALRQDTDRVSVDLEHPDGTIEQAAFDYVVGCDGAHSAVRHALGIGFPGDAFPAMFMLGDVHIDWDLPRGRALVAVRPAVDRVPDMFIAIPLPEPGRYRVSSLAPADIDPAGGTDHGLQAQVAGPDLAALQAIADDLLPGPARLSELRWSSLFRISMRIADRYADGRVFIAGDAAHIHPPTGGQGMNTGIQDAFNLGWKLARVVGGAAPAALLDSYDAERRPVGHDVVERTRAASEGMGRGGGHKPDHMADTQLLVSYRGTPWVRDDAGETGDMGLRAGDRAPDAHGLRRRLVGFPLRLFDVLRGTAHILLVHVPDGVPADGGRALAEAVAALGVSSPALLRTVIVAGGADEAPSWPGVSIYTDDAGEFASTYGAGPSVWLMRPDGYIGWRGQSVADPGLAAHLAQVFASA